MELSVDGKPVVQQCLEQGLILVCTLEKIIRFLPPLIVCEEDIDRCVDVLDSIFIKMKAS